MTNEMERAASLTRELLDFIDDSPVSYWVVQNVIRRLEDAGYRRFDLQEGSLLPGGKYYLTRNGASIIAFRLPEENPSGFLVAASHCDSPLFKIKTNYAVKACDRYLKLDTEPYGGGIFASWFDRPLSIAGRVIVREDGCLKARPVKIDRDLCIIPNTCIHFNRDINSGYTYNAAVDTLPLLGAWTDAPVLADMVAENLEITTDSIVSMDLFLYNRTRGTILGNGNEFFGAPRIDDQQCVFAMMKAFLESGDSRGIPVLAIFDNEEVGSQTKQGAASDMLHDVLERIALVYNRPLSALLPASLMLSCDNAQAMHPNHPELSDALNAPHMNEGVVIKHNVSMRYTTDVVSEALFLEICRKANIPVQHFANRSDLKGGTTLGTIAASRVSMNAIDIGLAQLAMHSSYETAGIKDTAYLVDACTAFFTTVIRCKADGEFIVE